MTPVRDRFRISNRVQSSVNLDQHASQQVEKTFNKSQPYINFASLATNQQADEQPPSAEEFTFDKRDTDSSIPSHEYSLTMKPRSMSHNII